MTRAINAPAGIKSPNKNCFLLGTSVSYEKKKKEKEEKKRGEKKEKGKEFHRRGSINYGFVPLNNASIILAIVREQNYR